MGTRLDFQSLLEGLGGVSVYFQPPPNVTMSYPAIVYNRYGEDVKRADNIRYGNKIQYQVTVIDRDPDSELPGQVAELPLSSFIRHFTTEGLNHDIYYVYF